MLNTIKKYFAENSKKIIGCLDFFGKWHTGFCYSSPLILSSFTFRFVSFVLLNYFDWLVYLFDMSPTTFLLASLEFLRMRHGVVTEANEHVTAYEPISKHAASSGNKANCISDNSLYSRHQQLGE